MPSAVTSAVPKASGQRLSRDRRSRCRRGIAGKGPRRRNGDCRLADPSCASQSDVPLLDQQLGNVRHIRFAANDAAQQWLPGRRGRFSRRQIVLDLGDAGLHFRDKFIAPARHGCNVNGFNLRITK